VGGAKLYSRNPIVPPSPDSGVSHRVGFAPTHIAFPLSRIGRNSLQQWEDFEKSQRKTSKVRPLLNQIKSIQFDSRKKRIFFRILLPEIILIRFGKLRFKK
jgi:hypothetical protein